MKDFVHFVLYSNDTRAIFGSALVLIAGIIVFAFLLGLLAFGFWQVVKGVTPWPLQYALIITAAASAFFVPGMAMLVQLYRGR